MKDFLLLHIPWFSESKGNDIVFKIAEMPMGFSSMADQLTKAGIRVEIANWAVEFGLAKLSLPDYVAWEGFKVIGMSLHWHFQAFDVLQAAQAIKQANPKVFIVLGGYTASAYAEEILRDYPFVDGVIKGEGEIPCVALYQALEAKVALDRVPNLCWRRDGTVIVNKDRWVASEQELNSFDFAAGMACQKRRSLYPSVPINLEYKGGGMVMDRRQHFTMELGRGCPGTCSWCGGGLEVVSQFTGRSCVTLRSPQVVAGEITRLYQQYPGSFFYICYDPFPYDQKQMVAIARLLGKAYPKQITVHFECFSLPTLELLQAFQEHLAPDSRIILSPDNAQESLRREMKSFAYSNAKLLESVRQVKKLRLKLEVYFAILPGEELREKQERQRLMEQIKQIYPETQVLAQSIAGSDPFSKWQQHPEQYGLKLRPRCFRDYLQLAEQGITAY